MKGLKKQRRIQIIILAFVAMGASFAAFYLAAPNALQYFRSPTEVAEKAPAPNETFRIGGLVEEGSLVRGQGAEITFKVTDTNATIPVSYTGVLPDLFGENEGVVATGKYIDGTFVATEILAKHDETYMPKEVIDALKDQGMYVDPNDAPATN
ncbi:cytochrome c-type biogenesis protein CcmE [Defluviimonas denitrificans]|jgi:cytochrome c-type biogenesis protein CcmE|uniref:Cytochrome c-type biogenesis protein CcmE n=1 Tax=Albidovulum denitrificans TaxID=404881 RepID=A0A2S8SDJ6_9RHOB|nr:cytochrome c maturation protein CcmE [Defluviimonas denitrificans]PQV58905.1 cytochrome c-type biogenesis protein CcmE [Defluviimonas denitrificans]